MERYDWSEIEQLVAEIMQQEMSDEGAHRETGELHEKYHQLRERLRPVVAQMALELVGDREQANRLASEFLERIPLLLPLGARLSSACSQWIGTQLIDFVYRHMPQVQGVTNPAEARLLEDLSGQLPRMPLDPVEQELLDRVRAHLALDEYLVWFDYVINGSSIAEIAVLLEKPENWVEQQLQRARQKVWDAAVSDEARRTRTDPLGQSLTWLGTPRDYDHSSVAHGVADTGAVVGLAFAEEHRYSDTRGNYATYIPCAFRWENHRFEILGELGENCHARGVISPGGDSIIVSSEQCQLRWNACQGVQRLSVEGFVHGMTACGEVLVGECEARAARWVNQMMEWLSGDNPSAARAISANGKVIVGHIHHQAVRWDDSGRIQPLGTLGGERSEALGVSFDGTVIIGRSDGRAFRWTPDRGMCALISREDDLSQAHSISYDGTRIVGEAVDDTGQVHAFLWTKDDEMQDLNVLFAHLRDFEERLERAYAISPNGRYIVGEGYRRDTDRVEAFLLDLGELSC